MQHPDQLDQHPDEGTIHAWLDGELPADERARLERHIGQCAECAAAVAEARGMIAGASRIVSALDVVPGGVIPLPPPQKSAPSSLWRTLRFTPARAALAASLLLAVGTLLSVRHNTSDVGSERTAASPAPAAAPSAAEPVVPPTVGLAPRADTTRQPAPAPRVLAAGGTAAPPAPVASPASPSATATSVPQAAALAEAESIEARSVAKLSAAPAPLRAVMTDSMSARDAAAAPAFAGRRAAAGAGAAGNALSQFAMTGATQGTLQNGVGGCFQVLPGGGASDSASWTRVLPPRFQLSRIDSGSAQGSVRALTTAGRIDSIVPGVAWRPISANLANLELVMGPQTRTLTLRLAGGPGAGQAAANSQSRVVGITHADCRP